MTSEGTGVDWDALLEVAAGARKLAYAPYSRFEVGAALITPSGEIFRGCNVENRSYGLTICAERTAVVSLCAAGHRSIRAVAVVANCGGPVRPCGMCLDTLQEFAVHDCEVLLANTAGERELFQLADLLPYPFTWDAPTASRS